MSKHNFMFRYLVSIVSLLGVGLLPLVLPIPIPADNIQGLYHPFRDLPTTYPNGVPYKNSLITDPVRQQFPWKLEALLQVRDLQIPLWNPYSFSGTPLLANIQSGVFYPLNIIFFLPYPSVEQFDSASSISTQFIYQWSLYIYAQSILGFLFMYFYLRKISLSRAAAIFGGIAWIFCGFNAAWWEWGNIGHTIIWFPLILFIIEQLLQYRLRRYYIYLVFVFAASFLAGHWQTFFFILINTFFYIWYRMPLYPFTLRRILQWGKIAVIFSLFLGLTAIQWLPSLEFILKSSRSVDQSAWLRADWFFPYEHLIGLIVPDYFGNPSTQNYWGVWNYGEFALYVGVFPLVFALSIIFYWLLQKFNNFYKSKQNTLDVNQQNIGIGYFLFCLIINLLLITRNPLSELPYHFPPSFFSSSQPSRGIVMVDFSLVVLAAVGFHYYFSRQHRIRLLYSWIALGTIVLCTNLMSFSSTPFFSYLASNSNIDVARVVSSNLRLPVAIISTGIFLSIFFSRFPNRPRLKNLFAYSIIAITLFDITRFFVKFNAFVDPELVFPKVVLLNEQDFDKVKYMTDDSRILAPNLNIPYQIPSVDGYDPLYYAHYGKFVGMWVRNAPDLSPYPANRILTPQNWDSRLADIAGVQSLYSLSELKDDKLLKQAQFGQTRKYLRILALQPINILPNIRTVYSETDAAHAMFDPLFNLQNTAIVLSQDKAETLSTDLIQPADPTTSNAEISSLQIKGNVITTSILRNEYSTSLLYLPITYDESWSAIINGDPQEIYRTNFSFLGVVLPKGDSQVRLQYLPRSFMIGSLISGISLVLIIAIAFYPKQKAPYDK